MPNSERFVATPKRTDRYVDTTLRARDLVAELELAVEKACELYTLGHFGLARRQWREVDRLAKQMRRGAANAVVALRFGH